MIPSLARITSECCHAPDAVNVNIASSESVPVFSWLIRWQPSRCPPILDILDTQPHLLSPVYPAHTSSPALNTQTHVGHGVQPLLSNTSCCVHSSHTIPSFIWSKIGGWRRIQILGLHDTFCVTRVHKCGVCAGTSDICQWSLDTPTHCIHHCQGTSGPGPWGWGHW